MILILTSVTQRMSVPLQMMAVPVTTNGRKNPADVYIKAPMTGPTARPKLKKASNQALIVDFWSGNLAMRIDRLDVHVAAIPTP